MVDTALEHADRIVVCDQAFKVYGEIWLLLESPGV